MVGPDLFNKGCFGHYRLPSQNDHLRGTALKGWNSSRPLNFYRAVQQIEYPCEMAYRMLEECLVQLVQEIYDAGPCFKKK